MSCGVTRLVIFVPGGHLFLVSRVVKEVPSPRNLGFKTSHMGPIYWIIDIVGSVYIFHKLQDMSNKLSCITIERIELSIPKCVRGSHW